jgi:hypothetical protein
VFRKPGLSWPQRNDPESRISACLVVATTVTGQVPAHAYDMAHMLQSQSAERLTSITDPDLHQKHCLPEMLASLDSVNIVPVPSTMKPNEVVRC